MSIHGASVGVGRWLPYEYLHLLYFFLGGARPHLRLPRQQHARVISGTGLGPGSEIKEKAYDRQTDTHIHTHTHTQLSVFWSRQHPHTRTHTTHKRTNTPHSNLYLGHCGILVLHQQLQPVGSQHGVQPAAELACKEEEGGRGGGGSNSNSKRG